MALFSPMLRAQIKKELICIFSDPRARFALILPPLLQLFLFSFAVTLDVKNVNLVVFNQDSGQYAREFVSTLNEAEFVGHIKSVHSLEQLEDDIEMSKAIGGIIVPNGFSEDIMNGKTAKTQLILDGRRANAGQIVYAYIAAIASQIGVNTELIPANTPELIGIRYWFNPALFYQWFVVPSLAAILVTMSSLNISTMSIAREREFGTFDQLLVSPANYIEIIIAKIMPALIIAPMMGLFMILSAIFLFGVPFIGNFFYLILAIFCHIFSVIGIGLSISAISDNQQQAMLGSMTLAIPMMLLSGFSTPVENMPHYLQVISEAIPNKHLILILQGSFLKGQGFSDIFVNVLPLIITGIVGTSFATLIVRSKLQ